MMLSRLELIVHLRGLADEVARGDLAPSTCQDLVPELLALRHDARRQRETDAAASRARARTAAAAKRSAA